MSENVFCSGSWRTPAGMERRREQCRKRKRVENMTSQQVERERERGRMRAATRVRLMAGGIDFHIGYAPTPAATQHLRSKIREEAPRGLA